ncbi:hypothetical protein CAPTEDRAFT_213211 [Capitella teleta]|uniref:Endonuclease/exonuclease/phosphatase domain-containing protein n=1 Tax=Capitella teleta TaxID=283909 RepID=R7T5V4_CAPTE|nr:hypothetical protein CAPTEDRAFT_213211 [Capitella teleta]|eukprot:ELT88593.1 hypothetical protein CAPTEDRAFT_213211 [Capitella teleta]
MFQKQAREGEMCDRYKGCYEERYEDGRRALEILAYKVDGNGVNSNGICIGNCSGRGYTFAGTQNKQDEVHVKSFKQTLDTLNMKQHVEGLSHTSGNTLDLLISDCGASDRVNGIVLEDTTLSDHFLIEFDLETNRVFARNNTRTCRKLRRMDMAQFVNTLQKNIAHVDLDKAVGTSLDTHAPLTEVTLRGDNHKPWYDDDIHEQRRKRRQLERQCRRTNLAMHKDMFKVQSKYVVTLIKDKKAEYYQQRIRDADHKDTFKMVKTLLKPPDNQQGRIHR